MYMNEIPVTILLLLLAFMGCLVGGPNNIITSAVAADLADDPSIKGNNKVRCNATLFNLIRVCGPIQRPSTQYYPIRNLLFYSFLILNFLITGFGHSNRNHQWFWFRDSCLRTAGDSNPVPNGYQRWSWIQIRLVLFNLLHSCWNISIVTQNI